MLEPPWFLPRFGVRSCILWWVEILCCYGVFFCLPFWATSEKAWNQTNWRGSPNSFLPPSEGAQICVDLKKLGIIETQDSALDSFNVFGGAGNAKSQRNSVSVTSSTTPLKPSSLNGVFPRKNPDGTWKNEDFQPWLRSFWKSLVTKQYQISIRFVSNMVFKSGTTQFPEWENPWSSQAEAFLRIQRVVFLWFLMQYLNSYYRVETVSSVFVRVAEMFFHLEVCWDKQHSLYQNELGFLLCPFCLSRLWITGENIWDKEMKGTREAPRSQGNALGTICSFW